MSALAFPIVLSVLDPDAFFRADVRSEGAIARPARSRSRSSRRRDRIHRRARLDGPDPPDVAFGAGRLHLAVPRGLARIRCAALRVRTQL